MKISFSKLLLNWKSPISGRNFPVGVLQKKLDNGLYVFSYNISVVEEAKREGFIPFIGISDIESVYESKKLFSVFERRLPNTKRNDFQKFLSDNDLQSSNDVYWDYLCLTKGKLATDSLTFMEPIVYEKKYILFSCEVAGWSYTKSKNRVFQETGNIEFIVRIDDVNPEDSSAVEFIDQENHHERVGYIPRPFNLLFYRLLKQKIGVYSKVYHLGKEDNRPHVLIFTENIERKIIERETDLQYLIEYHK
jgi:hypothetical protein